MHHPAQPAALAAAILLACHAHAQESENLQTITVKSDRDNTRTEDVNSYTTSAMRTTTGLTLSPRETPQSVSVITKTQLDDQGLTTIEDALRTTTGVNVTRHGTRTVYQSRGFFIEQIEEDGISNTIGAPGVTGNPFRDPKQQMDLALYDHIEVVRGATGLTQANSEPGGTINAVRKKPTDNTQIRADAIADRFGKVRATGDVSGTLNEPWGLRGRVVAVGEHDDSFKRHVDGSNGLLYGVLDQKLGDNSKLTLGGYYQNQHDTPDPNGLPLSEDGSDLRLPRKTFLGANWNEGKFRKRGAFLELEHEINDDWRVSSKLDYKRTNAGQNYASLAGGGKLGGGAKKDGTLPLDGIEHYDHSGKQFAFQTNLNGSFNALGHSHDLFLTYSYNREKTDVRGMSMNTNDAKYNIYTWRGDEIPRPDWTHPDDRNSSNNYYTTHGISGGLRLNPTDNLHLLAGTRYTHWKRNWGWHYDLSDGKADSRADRIIDTSKSRFVPYFGVTYDLDPHNSLYASYTSIFKYNSNVSKTGGNLPATLGNNIEVGWKGEWYDGDLNATVALYQINQKNTAVNSGKRLDDGSKRFYFEPMTLKSHGVDAEISGKLTDAWQMFAGYSYNTRQYTASIGSIEKGSSFNKQTPKHMLRLYTSYRLPGAAEKWTVGLGMSTQSSTSSGWDVKNGGHTLWNANVQYKPTKDLNIGVAINNLTDKRYYENHGIRAHGWGNFYGEPRNVMLSVKWELK